MKKFIAIILTLVVASTLFACSREIKEPNVTTTTATTSAEVTEPTSNKTVYKKTAVENLDDDVADYYDQNYIVFENDKVYFSTDLTDKILESTYSIDENNLVHYDALNDIQDWAFYTSSIFELQTIEGKEYLVIGEKPNGVMLFEKVE